jgi:hypothetical protein
MSTMDYTETLAVTHCWCGIAVAIPENLMTYARRHKGKAVYCPLGHEFVFGNSVEEQLAEEKRRHRATQDLLRAEEDARHAEERSHAQTRGQLRKTRERVAAGVCPFCHRSFAKLAAHMESKHPGEVPHTHVKHDERKTHGDAEQIVLSYLREHGASRFGAIYKQTDLGSSRTQYALRKLVGRGEVERYGHGGYRVPV